MRLLGADTETDRIRRGCGAPPLVSVAHARGGEFRLLHHSEARPEVVAALKGDEVIVGAHTAFDMAVYCAEWPELTPLVFEAYASDRVTDVLLREKLLHIALGVLHKFDRVDGEVVHLGYSLADLCRRHLRLELDKGADTYRMRFGEFRDVPVEQWPEEAVEYAATDATVLLPIYEVQEAGREYLEDEYRQARAAFWIQLMEVWGMPVDPEGVRAFTKRTHQKYTEVMDELVACGLAEKKRGGSYSRKDKAARERMAALHPDVPRTEPTAKHPDGQAKVDDDTCQRFGDEVMKKYAEASSLQHTLSTNIPILLGVPRINKPKTDEEKAEAKRREGAKRQMLLDLLEDRPVNVRRIWTRYDSLKNSGRTGSGGGSDSGGNFQNWNTDVGMRECVVPAPGKVLAVADYSQFELRTWSQCCLWMFGTSKMAQFLNSGGDPHIEIACRILNVSYEEAAADYARDRKGRVYWPRQCGKCVNFGKPGGLQAVGLVEYARKNYGVILSFDGKDGPNVFELDDYWYTAWPESHLWFEELEKLTENEGAQIKQFVSNRFRGNVSLTDGANSLFQGLAADAAKAAGFLIARACYAEPESPLYGWRTCNSVHDEFVLEGPDDERAHDAAVELGRLMRLGAEPFLPDVPAEVEEMLCRRWSKAAKPLYDLNRRLVPWDFGVEDRMKAEGTLYKAAA